MKPEHLDQYQLSLMEDAIIDTIILHEQSEADGVPYGQILDKRHKMCPLCSLDNELRSQIDPHDETHDPCELCPWMMFYGCMCYASEYKKNIGSIKRLTEWLTKTQTLIKDMEKQV
jgi:hypothetical protein